MGWTTFSYIWIMKKLGFILLLLMVLNTSAQERRFQLWNKNGVEIQPVEKLIVEVGQKIHYTPKTNSLDLKFGELFLGHEAYAWMEYGAGFRVQYNNLYNGSWLQENRSMLFLNLIKEIDRFELVFSNRMEYRNYKKLNDHFRHRQSLKLDFPGITSWGMQFYIAEESFFKFDGAGTHLARLYTGLTAIEKEHFSMKLYYTMEKLKGHKNWMTTDIVGMNFSLEI